MAVIKKKAQAGTTVKRGTNQYGSRYTDHPTLAEATKDSADVAGKTYLSKSGKASQERKLAAPGRIKSSQPAYPGWKETREIQAKKKAMKCGGKVSKKKK